MDLETPFRALLTPLGLDLYDVELAGGSLVVSVSSPNGVTVDDLTRASGALSVWLDEHDPIPGRYTLDVASPGLERKLRTAAQYAQAVGDTVTLREIRDPEPTRRLEGRLTASTETTVTVEDRTLGSVTVPIDRIERARTVFEWPAAAKAGGGQR